MKDTFRIYNHLADMTACGLHRCIYPSLRCNQFFAENGIPIEISISNAMPPTMDHDVYILHRIPMSDERIPKIMELASRGRRIIWETDDDLFTIPEWNPAKKFFSDDRLDWAGVFIGMSESIIVSTEFLKRRLLTVTDGIKKVDCLPNLMYTKFYNDTFDYEARNDRKSRIMWTGSNSHSKDIEVFEEVARACAKREDMEFIIYGFVPESILKKNQINLIYIHSNILHCYIPTLSYISPHISFVPLVDHIFNKSKSPIKYFEGVLAGSHCLVSDLEPYSEAVRVCGGGTLMADLSPESWQDEMESVLAKGKHWLREENAAAREKIHRLYSWDGNNENKFKWINYFMDLAGLPPMRP